MIINYDYIKLNLLYYQRNKNSVVVDFARRSSSDLYLDILNKFMKTNKIKTQKVDLIMGLIYLNMSPLHHPPFDQALYSLALYYLSKEIYKNNIFIK